LAIDPEKLTLGIIAAYASALMLDIERRPFDDAPILSSLDEPEWLARVDEAIGPVFADRTHIGGELMASTDAIERIHDRLRETPDDFGEISRVLDVEFGKNSVALEA